MITNGKYLYSLFLSINFVSLFIYGQISPGGLHGVTSDKVSPITYAIIIGISDYYEVQDLQFAHADALKFADQLYSKSNNEIDSANMFVLLNSDATGINIGEAFNRVYKQTIAGDRVYVFFAGHGDIEMANPGNNGLLLLYKAPKNSYFAFGSDYLQVTELRKFSQSLINKDVEVVIVADACRSGKLAGGKNGITNTTAALSEQWSNEMKILSCQPDELSLEGKQWGGGQGLFTYYLCQGLAGLADKDKNREVNLLELENYLEENVVRDASPSFQTPFTTGNKRSVLSYVDPIILERILAENKKESPTMAYVNSKSGFEIVDDTLKALVYDFETQIENGNLIKPEGNNALETFYKIKAYSQNQNYSRFLQKNLAAACQEKAMDIIVPIMKQEKFKDPEISEIELAAIELDTAIYLLGSDHYMRNSFIVQQLFLEAFALSEKFRRNIIKNIPADTNLLDTAINKLQLAIEVDSNLAYPYFQLGWIFNTLELYDQSLEVHKKYIELVPNNKRAYNNLGYLYDGVGEYDSAIVCFRRSIKIDPEYAKSYNNMGLSYYWLNNPDSAIFYLHLATIKDPKFEDAFYNLGNAYLLKREITEAKEALNKALDIDPTDCYTFYSLACTFSVENKISEALDYLEKSLLFGFTELEHIQQDTDLNNIRNESKFKALIKKYSIKK